ncbi:MAG: LicD family protein [Firmicutes bacterium]|nr:LicD family protein [Bacillota bacterium]
MGEDKMKELTLDQIKERQLNMLAWIDELCRREGIGYSVAYGTMIGAIRHGGYIPWDDDVDLFMTRANLDRFIKAFRSINDSGYHLLNWENNYFNFTKVIDSSTTVVEDCDYDVRNYGVWIDIFPVDNLPNPNSEEAKTKYAKMNKNLRLSQIRGMHFRHLKTLSFPKNIVWLILRICLSVFPLGYFGKKVDDAYLDYNDKYTGFMGYLPQCSLESNTFPAKYFDEYIDIVFDGKKLRCLKEYDAMLRGYYGDYMQLPPEDKRVSGHSYRAFLKEDRV